MKGKFCWIVKEYKKGLRLGISIGNNKTRYIPKIWFNHYNDLKRVLKGNIVVIEMK